LRKCWTGGWACWASIFSPLVSVGRFPAIDQDEWMIRILPTTTIRFRCKAASTELLATFSLLSHLAILVGCFSLLQPTTWPNASGLGKSCNEKNARRGIKSLFFLASTHLLPQSPLFCNHTSLPLLDDSRNGHSAAVTHSSRYRIWS
jgi:hypothetical protein